MTGGSVYEEYKYKTDTCTSLHLCPHPQNQINTWPINAYEARGPTSFLKMEERISSDPQIRMRDIPIGSPIILEAESKVSACQLPA